MKKIALLILMIGLMFPVAALYAEDSANPAPNSSTSDVPPPLPVDSIAPAEPVGQVPTAAEETASAPAISSTPELAPASVAAPAALEASTPGAASPAVTVNPAPAASENLEFVSGEITSLDESAKTVTVKLYGETENAANDKILTVKLDTTTDITDGEKDRDIKSLTNGTEVDVEYDPATNKATYIFVY